MVTVAELIEALQEYDPELPMALSSDEEGNNIRILHGVGLDIVREIQYQYMEVIDTDYLEEYDLEQDIDNYPQIVTVW